MLVARRCSRCSRRRRFDGEKRWKNWAEARRPERALNDSEVSRSDPSNQGPSTSASDVSLSGKFHESRSLKLRQGTPSRVLGQLTVIPRNGDTDHEHEMAWMPDLVLEPRQPTPDMRSASPFATHFYPTCPPPSSPRRSLRLRRHLHRPRRCTRAHYA